MKDIKETCYKGTRILLGNEKRLLIDKLASELIIGGFEEISMPIIQYRETFNGKVGEENNNLMYNFTDRGNRELCLAPEYTAIIQKLSKTTFKHQKDIKLFYIQECFRGEKPQAGRYRQFTQLGVEVINPSKSWHSRMRSMSENMIIDILKGKGLHIASNGNVTRGLDYYKDGKGFEITVEELGAQKQVCGGGEYDGGIGFAIGIDRLLLLK